MDPQIVSLVSACTALVASVAGPLATVLVSRRQFKATVLSAGRQNWIDALRDLLADLMSQLAGVAGRREEALDRYFARYGHLPLASPASAGAVLRRWAEACEDRSGMWEAVWAWANAGASPSPLRAYHASRALLDCPDLVPQGQAATFWARTQAVHPLRSENEGGDTGSPPDLMVVGCDLGRDLARHYLGQLLLHAPGTARRTARRPRMVVGRAGDERADHRPSGGRRSRPVPRGRRPGRTLRRGGDRGRVEHPPDPGPDFALRLRHGGGPRPLGDRPVRRGRAQRSPVPGRRAVQSDRPPGDLPGRVSTSRPARWRRPPRLRPTVRHDSGGVGQPACDRREPPIPS